MLVSVRLIPGKSRYTNTETDTQYCYRYNYIVSVLIIKYGIGISMDQSPRIDMSKTRIDPCILVLVEL